MCCKKSGPFRRFLVRLTVNCGNLKQIVSQICNVLWVKEEFTGDKKESFISGISFCYDFYCQRRTNFEQSYLASAKLSQHENVTQFNISIQCCQ